MAEMIQPAMVPKVKLYTGEEIPCVGMGTFGSDRFTPEQVSNAVAGAIRCGYRMFDCAACYGNEDQIGEVFHAAFEEGVVERKDLFIMTKVWNDMHERVEESCRKAFRTCSVTTLICSLFTGHSRTTMHRDVMWIPEIRIPDHFLWKNL